MVPYQQKRNQTAHGRADNAGVFPFRHRPVFFVDEGFYPVYDKFRTGGDLKHITGKRMRSVRADVLEALIASIYLDGGLNAVAKFISRFWAKRLKQVKSARRDSKTELQEWAHAKQLSSPKYTEVDRSGPDHDPEFTIIVKIQGFDDEAGTGRSKRTAEQDAARKLLIREGVWDADAKDTAG